MELYLITGFLGVGKTTSIRHLLHLYKDKKIALIINEFGKEGIDGQLLKGYQVALEEINNGSIFCACKIDKFEKVLQEVITKKPEMIIVETSGLTDPTTARVVIEKFKAIHYKGCLAIVDAYRFHKIIHTVKVSKKQLRVADTVLINKVDLVSIEQLEKVKEEIYKHNPYAVLYEMTRGYVKKEWLEGVSLRERIEDKDIRTRDLTLQKVLLTLSSTCSYQQLKGILQEVIEETYRIKGFVQVEGETYLVDCVGDDLVIKKYETTDEITVNQLVVLSAEGKQLRKSLERVRRLYCEQLLTVEK